MLDVFPPFTASLRRPLNADTPSSTTTSWSFSSVAKVIPHGWFNALFEGITGLLPYLPTRSHLTFAPGRDRNESNTRGSCVTLFFVLFELRLTMVPRYYFLITVLRKRYGTLTVAQLIVISSNRDPYYQPITASAVKHTSRICLSSVTMIISNISVWFTWRHCLSAPAHLEWLFTNVLIIDNN